MTFQLNAKKIFTSAVYIVFFSSLVKITAIEWIHFRWYTK